MKEGSAIVARAPSVVAVVVTTDPGPWFDDVLGALAAQDYENLSVLVLVSGGTVDPTERVARYLPEAFVRRLPDGGGFAAAVNEALTMVDGATFFLLCHDDCAPAPDATHLMVEESFRSNAAVVCPKMLHWDDPRALLHVGQRVDKTGAVVERVQDGEIDAGQHDAVRDVFVAPGGCTLVRGDLLRALGGYDPGIVAMGEDLDLSWRAHVAGARVVVAPAATVRHLELLASGRRPPPPSDAPSLQALQRRHELAAVLTCYSWPHLLRVVPQALALALGEVVVATLAGDRRRARAVLHAWRWNFARRRDLRRRRAALAPVRMLGDAEVRSLQVRGSARLATYLSRLMHQGVEVAHGFHVAAPSARGTAGSIERGFHVAAPSARGTAGSIERGFHVAAPSARGTEGSIERGFADEAEVEGPVGLGTLGGRATRAKGLAAEGALTSRRARLVIGTLAAAVLVVGSRGLLGARLPLVGQFAPFPGWTALWHQFMSSWQPAGTGSHAPSSPALGFLAIAGTLFFGRSGLLQEVVVLGCIPAGAWGMSRLVRPFGSARTRLAATIGYLGLPLAVDALARGRWDGLVAYAATPWVVLQVAKISELEPFAAPTARSRARKAAASTGGTPASCGSRRRSLVRSVIALGVLEAVTMSFAPAMVVVVLLVGVGIAGGSLVIGGARRGARALAACIGATLVAAVVCAPWVVSTLMAGSAALSTLGLAGSGAAVPGWGGLLRMAVGPVGNSPFGWLLVSAALPALLLARGPRLTWAVRLWAIALAAWLLALVSAKGWAVPFAPSVDVLLAPAAVAVAAGIGLGVASFEHDLVGYRFGWRQGVAALSIGAIALGVLPVVAEAANGRWGLPSSGYETAVSLPAASSRSSGYRVLWLGDPGVLPSGGWSIGPGLAYATSSDGPPTLLDVWPPASPGPASRLAEALRVAMRGETVRLGHVLATARVRYVMVLTALAPRAPGAAAPTSTVPTGLVAALKRQEDLRTVPAGVGGVTIFENTALSAASRPSLVATGGDAGPAGILDPLGAAAELCVWLVVAAALVGRRRWLDWWWQPLVRAWRDRCMRRADGDENAVQGASGADLVVEDPPTVGPDVLELVGVPEDPDGAVVSGRAGPGPRGDA